MILKAKYPTIIFFLFSLLIYGQVPNGYYDTANNLANDNLKYALNQVIDNHTKFYYMSSSTDVWDILKETDGDFNNQENTIHIYLGISLN